MSEVTTKAPPLGLRPRFIVTELRAQEIVAAMERYWNVQEPISQEWHDELAELNKRLEDHGYVPYLGFDKTPV